MLKKYMRELGRFIEFMAKRSRHSPREIRLEELTEFRATWRFAYPSSTTPAKVQEQLRHPSVTVTSQNRSTAYRQHIHEGRWEVVGAWPVEPDCNMPAAESFVRHALYGMAFCRRALGVDVRIGFNPDSFGHAAGLPTILKNSGYNAYVFMRPRDP